MGVPEQGAPRSGPLDEMRLGSRLGMAMSPVAREGKGMAREGHVPGDRQLTALLGMVRILTCQLFTSGIFHLVFCKTDVMFISWNYHLDKLLNEKKK